MTASGCVATDFGILVAIRDRAEIPRGSAQMLTNYFETIAGLCRTGHFDTRLLWSVIGPRITIWWAALQPSIKDIRAEQGQGGVAAETRIGSPVSCSRWIAEHV